MTELGEVWLYRDRPGDDGTRVVVESRTAGRPLRIRVRFDDGHVESVPPGRLKVLWEERDRYLASERAKHPQFMIVARWHAPFGEFDPAARALCGHNGHTLRRRLRADEFGPFSREQWDCEKQLVAGFFEAILEATDRKEERRIEASLAHADRISAQMEVLLECIDEEAQILERSGRIPPEGWPNRSGIIEELGLYGVYDSESAAALLGIEHEHLLADIAAGVVRAIPVDDAWMLPLSDLEVYAQATASPKEPPRGGGEWSALAVGNSEQLYTISEVAALLSVSAGWVRSRIALGELSVVKLGPRMQRIAASEVRQLIRSASRRF